MAKLIIVESPTKSKTIKKFLDKEYEVVACYGHIRDLAKTKFSLEIKENQILPIYVIPTKKRKIVSELKKKIKKYSEVILATDEDREGEAISWHLVNVLNLTNYKRIVFHEITRKAITEALASPRQLNFNLINAQQTRRILDRIVGYLVSPFLWKKIAKRLSAGRVQSVALKMIVTREREVLNFKPEKYYTLEVKLKKDKKEFQAKIISIGNKKLDKFDLTQEQAEEIKKKLINKKLKVIEIKKTTSLRSPNPPFITSTLTQTAWQEFGFPVKYTMQLAQELYEKGLITYMRTDSTHLAPEAIDNIRNFLAKKFPDFLPEKPKIYKSKSKLAQEAHEAIRPTNITAEIKLEKNLQKLYDLIWKRTIACQMKEAILEKEEVILSYDDLVFKASGQKILFPGFSIIEKVNFKEEILPPLLKDEELEVKEVIIQEHLTQPPARYNEGSLVKELESYGIGRPSTYATIISTLFQRGYIKRMNKNLVPTELGMVVSDFLDQHFPLIMDYNFTAKIEDKLDLIAKGKIDWQETLIDFYYPFKELVDKKQKEVEKINIKTGRSCPQCGSELIEKYSRYGKFIACSRYPECTYKENQNLTNISCPQCQNGFLVKRVNKRGQTFYGCSNFPKCLFVTNILENKT